MSNLEKLGWDEHFFPAIDTDKLARVAAVQRNQYRITDGENDYIAHVSGRFLNGTTSILEFPTIGDWVRVDKLMEEGKAVIHQVVPRKSQFIRQAAGEKTEGQLVAANVDTILIVNSLNEDLNIRRMERYVLAAYESGATPIIVLTKKDECTEAVLADTISEIEEIAIGVPIVALSSLTGEGLNDLLEYVVPKRTAALLGSSGVGKSTLVNILLGEEVQTTKAIRSQDSKGRHTTTHRELFQLQSGALLIDTPGMRELQLWEGDHSFNTTFQDVESFVEACYFTDCRHDTEPGCRVKAAIASGELSEQRFQSYLKLQRELAYEKRKQDQKAQLEEKNKWKQISKTMKKRYKYHKR
ncbi:hypothetical protein M948_00700 [Virgibacillus sp. CM-4]|uniref:ribosome small subunit-dependent GTPase A n=1 Tax=Virgibacillus sp. CM-4 TaxID=1354277 RepID=UPI000388779F|nr:ribosome small subunit-dependent GTPase A [Virgibacillus sp. CM-4]EQB38895.1 hypothetical protein M948_00700 [Virgibacillus sp. CM-4]